MQKKNFMLLMLVLILIVGCKSKHQIVTLPPVKYIERTKTELVPVYIHADSATLRAYFECDSLNDVLLKTISESKSSRVSSDVEFNGGVLNYKAKAQPDTVYLPGDSVIIEREKPYPVSVDKIVYKQTKLQQIFYMIGIIATTAVTVFLLIKIGLKRII